MPVPTLMCFNPRPHARGDTRHLRLTPSLSSFNPRPHARGDVKSDQFTRLDLVSIHAPTRGATFFSTSYIKRRMFQSTPPREGRPSSTLAASRQHCFNPRPHAGGDYDNMEDLELLLSVSIHAPTRGATLWTYTTPPTMSFNPRPHAGGDLESIGKHEDYLGFNPRPHAGGDRTAKRMAFRLG